MQRLWFTRVPGVVGLGLGLALIGPAAAVDSVHGEQPVQASVINTCRIVSIDGLMFGTSYDPIRHPAGSDAQVQGEIALACTKGASGWVGLGSGDNAQTPPVQTQQAQQSGCVQPARRLHSLSGVFLDYTLTYTGGTDGAQPWGCDASSAPSFTSTSVNTPVRVPTQAIIPGGQDVPSGDYTDEVLISVNF
jgi:spore coat protein U-like protein